LSFFLPNVASILTRPATDVPFSTLVPRHGSHSPLITGLLYFDTPTPSLLSCHPGLPPAR
jgi:hypothetical protein